MGPFDDSLQNTDHVVQGLALATIQAAAAVDAAMSLSILATGKMRSRVDSVLAKRLLSKIPDNCPPVEELNVSRIVGTTPQGEADVV